MKNTDLLRLGALPLAALIAVCVGNAKKTEQLLNIVVIMADDLAHGQITCYGAQ